jgi:hypothetical protein
MTDPRPTLEAPDDDPYLWLEEIDGGPALAWVEAQNAATLARFGDARFTADRDVLAAIFDRPDNIPVITRRGTRVFNFWKDAAHPRGLWRATSLDSFRNESPSWKILLDLDTLAAREAEDWTWSGAATIPGSHDRAVLRLARGGADAVVLREFDLASRDFVPGGFALPEAKGGAAWLDRDTLLLSSALGDGMATSSGYARTVRLWRRGTDPLAAPVIFETAADHMGVWPMSTATPRTNASGSPSGSASSMLRSGSATAPAPRRGSIFRPMPHLSGIAVGSPSSGGALGRSSAKPTRPTPFSAFLFRLSLPETAASPNCSSRSSAARCKGSSGPAATSLCRSSMT